MLLNVSVFRNFGGISHADATVSEIMGLTLGEIFDYILRLKKGSCDPTIPEFSYISWL